MIRIEDNRKSIANGLSEFCKCTVVMANQTAAVPDRPYISFTITTPAVTNNGTYGRYPDYTERKPIKQIWSITTHAEDADEAFRLALMACDWFDNLGTDYLLENDVIVERLTDITNRDNLLTSAYEYRCGFDITFTFMNIVKPQRGVIETTGFKNNSYIKKEEI